MRTHTSPKFGQDQVWGGVSVLCWHAALVANVIWKVLVMQLKKGIKFGNQVKFDKRS